MNQFRSLPEISGERAINLNRKVSEEAKGRNTYQTGALSNESIESNIDEIKTRLKIREEYLASLKQEKEDALLAAPEGYLRICRRKNKAEYYHRTAPNDPNGIYIREKDVHIAQALAQKDYDQKVIRAAERELDAINKYLTNYPDINVEQTYEQLYEERQKLIIPIRETEEKFVQNWEQVKHQGKGFDENAPEFYTAKGERVRSKSEVIIADALSREGIPYRYEYPVHLKNIGKVYPDFTVLNVKLRKEMYWEHLGMMDDEAYAEMAIQKITAYEKSGIFTGEKLILTYETRKNPINQKQILLKIRHYLKGEN